MLRASQIKLISLILSSGGGRNLNKYDQIYLHGSSGHHEEVRDKKHAIITVAKRDWS